MTPAAAEWVAKADNDFQSMSWEMKRPPTPNLDDACFHAQQCVEKMMKAVLMEYQRTFARTHDLFELAKSVKLACPAWNFVFDDLKKLMPGAVLFRYPGVSATTKDAQAAIAACTSLHASLMALL